MASHGVSYARITVGLPQPDAQARPQGRRRRQAAVVAAALLATACTVAVTAAGGSWPAAGHDGGASLPAETSASASRLEATGSHGAVSRTSAQPRTLETAGVGGVFRYRSYNATVTELQRLASLRPDLAKLWSTQEAYGLPTAGECQGVPCQNWVLEVTEHATLAANPGRPDILISGALHGDEQVGPATTIELARWLVQRYETDEWARRLVQTRRVLLVPMTNAWGCAAGRRDELGRDPNRDFPYEQKPAACMTTVTARTVNELYRHHLLQLALTFHGGMQAIGFNWGSFNYYTGKPRRSPDDVAIRSIAQRLSTFAGSGHVPLNRQYPYDTMNDLVYPVHGGMEDWGYGASWDTASVQGCDPSTFGGYARERTRNYHAAVVRSVVYLVEASNRKKPPEAELGSADAVLRPGARGDGHVPRNMRLALASLDLVEPHVQLLPPAAATERGADGRACLPLRWRVWGAVHVDQTSPLVLDATAAGARWHAAAPAQSGEAVWAKSGPTFAAAAPAKLELTRDVPEGKFAGCAALPNATGTVYVAVGAQVDRAWAATPAQPYSPSSSKKPQSHIANTRGNLDWRHEANGRRVRGQAAWVSPQLVAVALSAGVLVGAPRLVATSALPSGLAAPALVEGGAGAA